MPVEKHPDAESSRAKKLASKSLNIPTLPVVVQKMRAMIADPKSGAAEIGRLVAQDPPLAAKVLKIANSAFYGLPQRTVSTEQACTILGLRVLRNVITQAAVMTRYEHLGDTGFDLDALWRHSQLVAQLSHHLARVARVPLGLTPEEIQACGLLHDLGKVVLLESLGQEYLGVLDLAQKQSLPMHVAEKRVLGFDHTDVGALVAVQWGLPSSVAAVIQYHHGPRAAVAGNPAVALVANANLVVHRVDAGNLVAAAGTLDVDTQRLLGLDAAAVTGAVELLQGWISGAGMAA
ncbi:MAG: HDOD domain-containing protein [Planctomycetes bacterium]|nr:HDOD domain-containing protein [Planctomycetota bacterium]